MNKPAAPLFATRKPLAVAVQTGIRAGRAQEETDKRR